MHITTVEAARAAPPHASAIAWADLVAHRGYLVRFAQRRLRDPAQAEDAVHDVFEAVLSGRAAFGGRAALRSWLTAVLKHKIVDLVRRQSGTEPLADDNDEAGGPEIACPQPLPDEVAEQRERLSQTLARIDALPDGLRDALRLRVLEEQSTTSVCATLGISEENLFVRIHRARRQLLA
ncbi:MAG: sigma-70 family RNA polymerase sigma factor [Proteobacteria bacterium]|nr:sigma-70 family RNA polymerase sigma factor [Pseudomonadota bacterium]